MAIWSLWWMPEAAAQRKLEREIRSLSLRYGTAVFAPHVTLLGGLEREEADIVELTEAFAARQRSFPVEIRSLEFSDEFYRNFYAVVEGEKLLDAHFTARPHFSAPKRDYKPHLSLLYGNLRMTERSLLLTEFGELIGYRFRIEELAIFRTEGPAAGWTMLTSYPLKS